MKLLFVHDMERLKEDINGSFYTDGAYNLETWNRYLAISKDLSVIFRRDKRIYDVHYAKDKFNPVKEGIKFIEAIDKTSSIKDYISPKKKNVSNKIIEKAVIDNDYVIVRLPCEAGYTAIKYAVKYAKPYLVEVVGCAWDAYWNYNYKGKVLALPSYIKMRKSIKNANHAIYVTEKFLQKRYPCSGEKTNCSNVALTNFSDTAINSRLQKINQFQKSEKIIIGTTGAIDVKYKGQQYVIEALGELKKQGVDNFEYQIVGGGDPTYLLSVAGRYNVREQVKILGAFTHDKVFNWLDDIDIYIQPSVTEGLPRALIEAMSHGLPAFGSRVGGIPELLEIDCIFTKKSVNEIKNILFNINKEKMMYYAKRNFEESKKYDKELIDKRRNKFLKEFSLSKSELI